MAGVHDRPTETPARYISISASSTELSRRRYRSIMAVYIALRIAETIPFKVSSTVPRTTRFR